MRLALHALPVESAASDGAGGADAHGECNGEGVEPAAPGAGPVGGGTGEGDGDGREGRPWKVQRTGSEAGVSIRAGARTRGCSARQTKSVTAALRLLVAISNDHSSLLRRLRVAQRALRLCLTTSDFRQFRHIPNPRLPTINAGVLPFPSVPAPFHARCKPSTGHRQWGFTCVAYRPLRISVTLCSARPRNRRPPHPQPACEVCALRPLWGTPRGAPIVEWSAGDTQSPCLDMLLRSTPSELSLKMFACARHALAGAPRTLFWWSPWVSALLSRYRTPRPRS